MEKFEMSQIQEALEYAWGLETYRGGVPASWSEAFEEIRDLLNGDKDFNDEQEQAYLDVVEAVEAAFMGEMLRVGLTREEYVEQKIAQFMRVSEYGGVAPETCAYSGRWMFGRMSNVALVTGIDRYHRRADRLLSLGWSLDSLGRDYVWYDPTGADLTGAKGTRDAEVEVEKLRAENEV